jgi:hypothetical protein
MITLADIEAAERLVGIAYTASERSQMVGNLAGQIESARKRRDVPLANSMPMASRFDPRLPRRVRCASARWRRNPCRKTTATLRLPRLGNFPHGSFRAR